MSRRNLPRPIERPPYDVKALGAQCGACPYNALGGCNPVKPRLTSPKFLVILDQPDPPSVRHGELKTTASQKLLERGMASCGASDVSYLYATACRRPEGAKDKDVDQAIAACKPRLEAEVKQAYSDDGTGVLRWVLALGPSAFKTTTGKLGSEDPWRGSPMAADLVGAQKVLPSWDPWVVSTAKGSQYAKVWLTHVDRYCKLATGQLGDFQWPEVVVGDNPMAVHVTLFKIADYAERGGEVSVDIETRGLGIDAGISCIGLAAEVGAVCLQLPCSPAEDLWLRRALKSGTMVSQNGAAFDRRVLARAGYALTDKWEDTMLAASILDPQLDKNLGFLVNSEFHAEAHKAEFKADKETGVLTGTWDSTDREVERERRVYCLKDAYTTLLLWQRQKERLREYGQQFYAELKELTLIALEMRDIGIAWDFTAAKALDEKYSAKLEKARDQLRRAAETFGLKDFNPGSTKQLRELFYQKMKIAPTVWTEKGEPSTGDDALTSIISTSDNPASVAFAKKVTDYRDAQKALGTYIRGMAPEDGQTRVHGEWRAHTAPTGRWSCTGRGFQTLSAEMRKLLTVESGNLAIEADLPSAEVRTVMLFAGQDDIIDLLNDGGDLYSTAATKIFGRPVSKKENKHLRQLGKLTILASHYGASGETVFFQIWKDLVDPGDPESKTIIETFPDLTPKKVTAIQNLYFRDTAPKVKLWQKEETAESGRRGYYLSPIDGRKVALYGPPDLNFATNFPNQATVAWWMNAALRRIWLQLKPCDKLLTYIHDSLTLETPEKEVDRVRDLLLKEMEGEISHRGRTVQMRPVEYKVGRSLAEVK